MTRPRRQGGFGAREVELAQSLASLIGPGVWSAHRFEEQGRELAKAQRERTALLAGRTDAKPVILGKSKAIAEVLEGVKRVASGAPPVLILGESGTGKELVARAIHACSERRSGPFVAENMGALSPELVAAELFGHAKGAFTGADSARPGLFQLAEGGTLFLDEVGEMSADSQRKLLRVLQEREVRPVGGTSSVKVDARVLAATHRDLQAIVREGQFREDLYYRLCVLRVSVPPLRARMEDLPMLLGHFVTQAAAEHGCAPPALEPRLLAKLAGHTWPGNVRELQAFAVRLVVSGPLAQLDSPMVSAPSTAAPLEIQLRLNAETPLPIREARSQFDRIYLGLVLDRCQGKVSAAAKMLGLNRTYVSELVKRFDLRRR